MTDATADTPPEAGTPTQPAGLERDADPIGGRGAAFFDVDRTLIAGASALRLAGPLHRRGLLSRRTQLRSSVQQIGFSVFGADNRQLDRFAESARLIMKGWEQEALREVVAEELHATLQPTVYREALERIELHKRQGHPVYAVSATMTDVIAPFAEMIGMDGAIATEMEVVDGRFSGEIVSACHGPEKARRLREFAEREGIDLGASVAYSDSISDADFLGATGRAFAVNPDRELRKLAEEEGWGVLYFRTRVKAPLHHHRAARASAMAVVAGLAVRAFVRRRRR